MELVAHASLSSLARPSINGKFAIHWSQNERIFGTFLQVQSSQSAWTSLRTWPPYSNLLHRLQTNTTPDLCLSGHILAIYLAWHPAAFATKVTSPLEQHTHTKPLSPTSQVKAAACQNQAVANANRTRFSHVTCFLKSPRIHFPSEVIGKARRKRRTPLHWFSAESTSLLQVLVTIFEVKSTLVLHQEMMLKVDHWPWLEMRNGAKENEEHTELTTPFLVQQTS